jgi:uncharacterized protein YxjI
MVQSYDISGVNLTDDRYVVEQALVRSKYKATDASGNTVLRGKKKKFKLKEEFPFTDGDGNDVFTVKASGIVDVAGDYVLSDAQTGEELVILDNDYSLLQDTWKIRDAGDERKLAELNSRGAVFTIARHYLPFGGMIPRKYEITDADGTEIGAIESQFSIGDTYEVRVDDTGSVPKEPVVAAAMVIDAIQGH